VTEAREAALDTIAALAEKHGLTVEDIAGRMAGRAVTERRQSNILKQLLGYIGGTFVFAGLGLYTSEIWPDIGSLQRVLITLGTGVVAFILAFMCLRDTRYDKAATPFFLLAALLQTTGLFVFLHEYMPPSDNAELAVLSIFSIMGLQQVIVFAATRRTSLAFLSIFFWLASLSIGLDHLHLPGHFITLVCGISLLCISWAADKSPHRAMTPILYFIAGNLVLSACWDIFDNTALDSLNLAASAFMIYLSIRVASRTLLTVSVLSLLAWLCDFTYEHFAHTTAWPLALIVMGLIMIGLSSYAIKLGNQIKRARG
jgi:hypothetical protein